MSKNQESKVPIMDAEGNMIALEPANTSGQMKWSQFVDLIVANRLKFERKEIDVTETSQTYQSLLKELADEIRRDPYGEATALSDHKYGCVEYQGVCKGECK